MNKVFLIFSVLAVLALPEQAKAFECTRESVYREFNELKSKIDQETRPSKRGMPVIRGHLIGLLDYLGAVVSVT